jgi:endonuclease/exonuclease/phosphatase family metal-dependent hydrolase
MAAVGADVWVLTETRDSIAPSTDLYGISTPPHPERRPDPDERWVSIWSRWPLSPTGIEPDPSGSVSALVERPGGPFIVYGTVLPWANEKGADGRARMWEVHYLEIERQGREWLGLRERFPGVPIVVAGDFNQDRDGSGWYGTTRGRELLSDALDRASLVCLTSKDVVAAGLLRETHLVDHIAICRDWSSRLTSELSCWERIDDDGVRLSDHPTVAVDLVPPPDAAG